MDKIVFLKTPEEVVYGAVVNRGEHLCSIEFDKVPKKDVLTSGFYIANEYNGTNMTGDFFYEFTTVYKTEDTVIWLSNDGSIYEPPTQKIVATVSWNDNGDEDGCRPESLKIKLMDGEDEVDSAVVDEECGWAHDFGTFEIPNSLYISADAVENYSGGISKYNVMEYHECLSSIKNNKLKELDSACNEKMIGEVEIELSTGTQIFNFTELVQRDLANAYSSATALLQVGHPEIPIPFYNHEGICSLYLPNDVMAIYMALGALKTQALTLLHQLEDQVMKMTDGDAIRELTYEVDSLDEAHAEAFMVQIRAAEKVIHTISDAELETETE